MLGEAGSFFVRFTERAGAIDNLSLLTADLGLLSGLKKFMREYPDKFYNVGIAEQNMIGIAAGMAKIGLNVFATTYANFITMRSFEQIRVNLGYMQFPVKLVGSRAGLVMSMMGNTHYSFEDLAIMRSIPNITIVSPADALEAAKLCDAAIDFDKPLYIRLTGEPNTPIVYKEDYDFEIGKAIELRAGNDIAIFVAGSITANVLKAAELLQQSGIDVAVINMHTIKPLDTTAIDKYDTCKLIVTVEEHSKIGGLGGAIAEYNATKNRAPRQLFIGLPDSYGKAAEYSFLLDKYGLTAEKICNQIQSSLI